MNGQTQNGIGFLNVIEAESYDAGTAEWCGPHMIEELKYAELNPCGGGLVECELTLKACERRRLRRN